MPSPEDTNGGPQAEQKTDMCYSNILIKLSNVMKAAVKGNITVPNRTKEATILDFSNRALADRCLTYEEYAYYLVILESCNKVMAGDVKTVALYEEMIMLHKHTNIVEENLIGVKTSLAKWDETKAKILVNIENSFAARVEKEIARKEASASLDETATWLRERESRLSQIANNLKISIELATPKYKKAKAKEEEAEKKAEEAKAKEAVILQQQAIAIAIAMQPEDLPRRPPSPA